MNKFLGATNAKRLIFPVTTVVAGLVLLYSCGKSTQVAAPVATTCVNSHKTVIDSVCNMAGTRPAYEHHWHKVNDSGTVVANTNTNTNNVNFAVSVAPDKTVSFAGYAYTLVSSNTYMLHYTNTNLSTGNSSDMFYYPANDSFVIATVTTTYQPGITTTDTDSLLSVW